MVRAYTQNFTPYFTRHGFECRGVTLRSTVMETVNDMAEVAHMNIFPPVVIGHSLGCYAVYKYLESFPAKAVVYLNPPPPNKIAGRLVLDAIKRIDANLLTQIEAAESFQPLLSNIDALHRLMFEENHPIDRLEYFLERGFICNQPLSLMRDIEATTPPRFEKDHGLPMMVLGGLHDEIVPFDVLPQVAEFYGLTTDPDEEPVQWNQHCAHSTVLSRQGMWSADMILEFTNNHRL
eukprot:c14140_g1_i4.p1 GENE.c14140_g1_i4~~c14140_g1_i4.p1  ORF type:complete len:235 (+),score=44.31 c14140_g1_i4:273-977(+)